MNLHRRHCLTLAMAALGTLTASMASAQAPPTAKRKPDLGDVVEGTYAGDVISDSKGSSRSDVTLTVTRIGPNQVRVTSNYPRLPTITVSLTRAMDKILAARGDSTFLYDPAKRPAGLDVSFHNEVSWSGAKQ
jgi:hypothetical protein